MGVNQCSVLSPLLFIAVLEAISRRFDRQGLPYELLYADHLAIIADKNVEAWYGEHGTSG